MRGQELYDRLHLRHFTSPGRKLHIYTGTHKYKSVMMTGHSQSRYPARGWCQIRSYLRETKGENMIQERWVETDNQALLVCRMS